MVSISYSRQNTDSANRISYCKQELPHFMHQTTITDSIFMKMMYYMPSIQICYTAEVSEVLSISDIISTPTGIYT